MHHVALRLRRPSHNRATLFIGSGMRQAFRLARKWRQNFETLDGFRYESETASPFAGVYGKGTEIFSGLSRCPTYIVDDESTVSTNGEPASHLGSIHTFV